MSFLLSQIPSVLLALVSIIGLKLQGDKRRLGWACSMVVECGWIYFAVRLRQYGLVLACIIYIVMYVRNWRKWSAEATLVRRAARDLL